jgi:hypothetical protein
MWQNFLQLRTLVEHCDIVSKGERFRIFHERAFCILCSSTFIPEFYTLCKRFGIMLSGSCCGGKAFDYGSYLSSVRESVAASHWTG